jgi:hypothetical protein
MARRILSCIAFLIGGIITFAVLSVFSALGHMEAGMSAVSIAGTPKRETFILWLACSYFVVSAVGVCVTERKSALRAICLIAHTALFIAFCLLCSEGLGHDVGTFFGGLLTLCIGMTIFFFPWFVIWGLILTKAKDAP